MNKLKGDLYENYVKEHIVRTLPDNQVYLWKDVPESLLIKYGIFSSNSMARVKRKINQANPFQDTGIDLISIDNLTNQCAAIQCKNGYANGLTLNDLAGFSWMVANNIELNPVVYYTSKLSPQIKMSNNRIKFNRFCYTPENSIPTITAQIQEQIVKKKRIKDHLDYIKQILDQTIVPSPIKPFGYQIDACNKIIEHLEINNKAILSLPCGCGKTYTSYMISKYFNKIVIISPLKQFAKQNLSKFKQYGYLNPTLLIDSDGTRDLDEITEFISTNKQFLLSVTFKSVDVIAKLGITGCLIIIDEFHNLTKANISDPLNPFFQVLDSLDNKFLLMSATPRIYELENNEDINEYIDLADPIYSMSFSTAIENGYITDYKIFLPSIHETNEDLIVDISSEVDIDSISSQLLAKTTFLFKGLLDQGARKCIVYVEGMDELEAMADAIELLNQYYLMDLNVQQITAKTSYRLRNQILTQFENSTKLELLFSIRILDECVDIPSCDSIYITYSSESKIRTIQRLCRCVRINKSNPFKIAKVFIWTDQYSKILPTLSSIKEYDQNFNTKISVLGSNWFSNDKESDQVELDIKLVKNYVVGIKEFIMYTWHQKFEMVKDWIDLNQKRPTGISENLDERKYSAWISSQIQNYKKYKESMRIESNRIAWDEFVNNPKYFKFFMSLDDKWNDKLNQVIEFIEINGFKPSRCSKDSYELHLARWVNKQFENKKDDKKSMKNKEQQEAFDNFVKKYEHLFNVNMDIIWYEDLGKVEKFIEENGKRPNKHVEGLEYELATWLGNQLTRYKNSSGLFKTNQQIKQTFEQFCNKHEELFRSKEDAWYLTFKGVKLFFDTNKKRPTEIDNYVYARWISHQMQNYKNKKDIMKIEKIYNQWDDFINSDEYSIYFKSLDQIWEEKFIELKEFIKANKSMPKKFNGIIYNWLNSQKANYNNKSDIMKIDKIYNQWTEFINSDEYSIYFKSLDQIWEDNFIKLKEFIKTNKSLPKKSNGTIYNWLNSQKANYKNKSYALANPIKYSQWKEFIESNEYLQFEIH